MAAALRWRQRHCGGGATTEIAAKARQPTTKQQQSSAQQRCRAEQSWIQSQSGITHHRSL